VSNHFKDKQDRRFRKNADRVRRTSDEFLNPEGSSHAFLDGELYVELESWHEAGVRQKAVTEGCSSQDSFAAQSETVRIDAVSDDVDAYEGIAQHSSRLV
jgi:hypothetical protein